MATQEYYISVYIKAFHQIKDGTDMFCVTKLSISAVVTYTRLKHMLVLTLANIIDVVQMRTTGTYVIKQTRSKHNNHRMVIQEHICQH
jgi:hypothetical protein